MYLTCKDWKLDNFCFQCLVRQENCSQKRYIYFGSRAIAPEKNCPPTLILTLTLNKILTLTGGNFPLGQMSGHHLFYGLLMILFSK